MQIIMPQAWLALAVLLAAEVVWASAARIGIDAGSWYPEIAGSLVLLGSGILYSRRSPRLSAAMQVLALWTAFTLLGVVLSYLCGRSPCALQDATFARLDRSLGFDWLAWLKWTRAQPGLATLLGLAYDSLLLQAAVTGVTLALADDRRRLADFFWVAFAACLVTSLVSFLLPALGLSVAYGIKPAWLDNLELLRSSRPIVISTATMTGVIQFPSYHTVLAILLIRAWGGRGCISAAVAGLDLLMIVSTLSIGGHYLVDDVGGVCTALISMALVQGGRALALAIPARRDAGVCAA